MAHIAALSVLWLATLWFELDWVIRDLAVWSFAWFLSSEWSAGGVRHGFEGTKTGFLYWTITDRWPRVLLGLYMGQMIFWLFPDDFLGAPFPAGKVLGGIMTLWLPPHYWRSGMKGPVDHAAIWIGERLGLKRLFERIRKGR